jgi:hypothetical protein
MQAEDRLSGWGAVVGRPSVGRGWRSLTMLNTTVDVTEFTSPWPMRPFRHRGVGEIWMRSLNRRQPSHGRSLSKRCGTHPGPAGEEWFRPDPQASKTAAVLLIPGRIMSPSPRPDAAVTVQAITILIRLPMACSCTNLSRSRERGGARSGMGHVGPAAPCGADRSTITRWARSYRRVWYLSGTPA